MIEDGVLHVDVPNSSAMLCRFIDESRSEVVAHLLA